MKKATLELSLKQHKSKNAMHEKKDWRDGRMRKERKRERKLEKKGDEEEKDTREGKIRNCEKIQNRAKRKREI